MIIQSKAKSLIWIAIAFFFGAGLLIIYILSGNSYFNIKPHVLGKQFELLCLALTISIVFVLTYYYRLKGGFDFFEYPVWITLNVYIQIIINVWLFQRDIVFRSPWLVNNSGEMAGLTVVLIWFSLLILWIAYFWGMRLYNRRKSQQTVAQSKPRLKLMGVVWFFAWSVNFYLTYTGSQGYLSTGYSFMGGNYLLLLTLIEDLVTFNLMYYHFNHPTKLGWGWMIFVCSTRLLMGMIIGTKGAVLILLYLAMAYFYARGRLPKTWLAVGVLAVFFVVPVVTTFRSNLFAEGFTRSSGASFSDRIPVFQNSVNEVLSNPFDASIGQTGDIFKARQGGIFEVMASFLAVHPGRQPFIFFDLVDAVASTIIPRFIWWDKPAIRPNIYYISTLYLGSSQELSFAASGQIADAYRVGGVAFILIWFGLTGLFCAWLYNAGPGSMNLSNTGFYFVVLTSIMTYDNDIFSIVVRLLQFGLLIFLFNKYVLSARSNFN